MKAIILTFSRISNRGANLQAYALKKVLEDYGIEVYFLDYQLKYTYLSIKDYVYEYINNYFASKFRKRMHFRYTRKYNSKDDLKKNYPTADIYIVGSDQVWNPSITYGIDEKTFFFDFLPDQQKRVSYAASFGENWNSSSNDFQIKELLSKFSSISVREIDGINILQKNFGIEYAKLVLDPSLLLSRNDIIDIIGEYKEKKRIYSYLLYENEEIYAMTELIGKTLSLPRFGTDDRSFKGKIKKMHGIITWLRNIATSSVIVTNSFHCMAVSLILNKKIFIIPSYPGREKRMVSLLKLLNREELYFNGLDDLINRINIVRNVSQYCPTDNKLFDKLRNDSKCFIFEKIAK